METHRTHSCNVEKLPFCAAMMYRSQGQQQNLHIYMRLKLPNVLMGIIFYYYCASFMKCIDPVCFQKCLYLDCPFAIKQRPWDAGSWITSLAPGALDIWREWWLDNTDRHLWRIVEGKWTVKLKVYAWNSHTVMDQLPAWGCICTCMTRYNTWSRYYFP